VTGHSLVDGNKRLGWVAVRLFYRLNETDVRPTADEAFDLIVGVADGTIRDVRVIAERLASWRTP
jgi:death-on-curing protein